MHLKHITLHPDKFPTDELYPFNLEVLRKTESIAFPTPAMISIGDGTGGALAGWFQVTEIPSASAGHQQVGDIAVQKVGASGNVTWQSSGIPLEIPNAVLGNPTLTSDSFGGVVLVWRDSRNETATQSSVFAQKVDNNGKILWQPGGVKVSLASINPIATIVSSGNNEAIVVYSFEKDWEKLHAQKLDGNGRTLWLDNGIPVIENGFAGHSVSPDGQGGLIVGWGVRVRAGTFSSEKAYIQKISAEGKLLWGEEGFRLDK